MMIYHAKEQSKDIVQKSATVALVGQPNVGKSTVFNLLTGLTQHVGNWPGKTIERKVGLYHHNGLTIEIIDLPGAYSLTANSLEERVTRDFILHEHPDVVIAIVSAAALERDLYLVAELLSLPVPMVLGINMVDVAEQQGIQVESHVLEAALGFPVVPMTASKNQGLIEMVEAVAHIVQNPDDFNPSRPLIRDDHKEVLRELTGLIKGQVPEPYPDDWIALKLLEGDEEVTQLMEKQLSADDWESVQSILLQHEDAFLAIASGRYEWIRRMMRAAMIHPPAGQITMTDRLDRVATHPWLGLLLLIGIFGLAFWLTYTLASPLQIWLENAITNNSAGWVRQTFQNAPGWFTGLVADGMIGGAGTVLTLLPVLVIFFAVLSFLEDVGYLARGAYVMDRFMHPMGLHGKSCLALFLGFGCNVPAVLGSRVVESGRGRLLTILLTPLIPCAGRLAVLAFLTPIFFPENPALVSGSLVAVNLFVLAVIGVAANRVFIRGEHMAFIMELPLYHLPNIRTIGLQVWHRSLAFLRHAGTIILAVSILVWILANIPSPTLETSLLAGIGRLLAPVGEWMGLDWRMMVALLSSFVAKENTIATLGILFHNSGGEAYLAQTLVENFSSASALAFLVVQMLFIPCVATVAVMQQELKNWRITLSSILFLLVISLTAGTVVYQVFTIFE